ncbi:hypothetical protein CRV04_12745 [Candidatus Marinarcus aquaticus]|uniref:Motility associated factor glycosyltransferase family protein n=2 Tax=Candidatus Marinarcus aquaticus TaxID=2044504 RepID=A0A4Q0XQ61_9BACT|nr:hypothetical protein CRV04_12745 [Candidatus Marinarcus aquaticus]
MGEFLLFALYNNSNKGNKMTTADAQQQLQEVLVNTYISNLSFLRDTDPSLYEKVISFSTMIEQNIYKERYHLEFLQDQGEFDIYDEKTNSYVYSKKPKQVNRNYINSIEFNKKGSISVFEPVLYEKQPDVYKLKINKEDIQDYRLGLLKLHQDMKPYLEILNADIQDKKKKYKYMDKFMFIGTLLGRHIPSIVNKIKSKHYFVHEPNLEIFRLSLFVLDYTTLLAHNANVFFSVMDEAHVFESKLYDYYKLNTWENHTIKFHTTDFNVGQSFESVMNAMIPAKPTLFGYNMMLYCVAKHFSKRLNHYKFLHLPLKKPLNIFENKPVLYVCAGPSLEDNIDWLKENKNRFVIVTIGAAYKKLLNEDILPDVIITLDANYEILNKLQFDEDSCKKIQDCIIFASSFTDQRILERFNHENIYLYETMITFSKNSLPLRGHSVGEMGYKILLDLGVKELYLLGTDLAVHQTKGSSHSSSASSKSKEYDLNNLISSEKTNSFSLTNELVKVRGNMLDEVYTTRVLNTSLMDYNKMSKHSWQNVYNLCHHGAYINNTIPTTIESIQSTEFQIFKNDQLTFIKQLHACIDEICIKEISKEDRLFLKEITKAQDELLLEIKQCSQKEYAHYEEFREDFISLFRHVLDIKAEFKNQTLSAITSLFFSMFNPYIDYAFNDPKVKDEKKRVNQIAKVWLEQYHTAVNDLNNYMKSTIN